MKANNYFLLSIIYKIMVKQHWAFLPTKHDLIKIIIFKSPNPLKVLSNFCIILPLHPIHTHTHRKFNLWSFQIKSINRKLHDESQWNEKTLIPFARHWKQKSSIWEHKGHQGSHWEVKFLAYLLIQVECVWMGCKSRITV